MEGKILIPKKEKKNKKTNINTNKTEVRSFGAITTSIAEIMFKIKSKEEDALPGVHIQAKNMMVNGIMIRNKDSENTFGQMAVLMK